MRYVWRILFFTLFIMQYAESQTLVNAYPNLTFSYPIFIANAGDCTNRMFVVQQGGIIKVFPNDSTATTGQVTNFLNITSKVNFGGSLGDERGLLGLAFHPNYKNNGYFYVNYTASSPSRTVVARYSVMPGNPNKADSLSEHILLQIYQPFSNHNGGMMLFGNDGYLYIGMGDGGSAGDPGNRAQNLDSLLGKILRIDIDTVAGYKIPPGNPLVGIAGRDEIFAWGMRNPWRGSCDALTGQIWWGDVGQGAWEEIDLIEIGKNYGWKVMEGAHCYSPSSGCSTTGLTFPVKEYSHSFGIAVTGGYVYRGYRRPELYGRYIYGDYGSGNIWNFQYNGGGSISSDSLLIASPYSVSSFGVDELGELYLSHISSTGRIYRFSGSLPPTVGTTLSSPANGSLNLSLPVTLNWACMTGAAKYRVEVDDDSAFGSPVIVDSTTAISYQANSLSLGVQYFWRVQVKNLGGWGSYTPVWSFTTESPLPPSAPALVSPVDTATNQPTSLTLSWSASAGASSYELQLAADSLFTVLVLDDSTLTGASHPVSGLATSTLYHWRVNARNTAGTSPWSDAWEFTTYVPVAPSAPVLVSPLDGVQDEPVSPVLTWATTSGTDSYQLQVSTDSLFGTILFDDSTLIDTSCQLSGLSVATTHFWRVNARNTVGTGPWSDTWEFTTTTMVTRQYPVISGWNMLSLPLSVNNTYAGSVYPGAISSAFTFSPTTGYVSQDTLVNGTGYWLKFAAAESLNVTGNVIQGDTVSVVSGWNMVGPISTAIDTGAVIQVPPGILASPFYEYSAVYAVADTLKPAKAYWVKASFNGQIVFSAPPVPASPNRQTVKTVPQQNVRNETKE